MMRIVMRRFGVVRFGRLCTPLKLVLLLGVGGLFLLAYSIKSSFRKPWHYIPTVCAQPKEVIEDNLVVANKVNKLLTKHNLLHFLCYGALIGALHSKEPLPQDRSVDFCVHSEDMESIEEGYLYQLFKFDGMTLSYDPNVGEYTVMSGYGQVKLILFELTDDYMWLQRIGILNRVLALFPFEASVKFPSALAAPPLPTVKLGWTELPAPRKEMEIQKYLFPNDWQREIKPPAC